MGWEELSSLPRSFSNAHNIHSEELALQVLLFLQTQQGACPEASVAGQPLHTRY